MGCQLGGAGKGRGELQELLIPGGGLVGVMPQPDPLLRGIAGITQMVGSIGIEAGGAAVLAPAQQGGSSQVGDQETVHDERAGHQSKARHAVQPQRVGTAQAVDPQGY
jgi:hypothetical protein